jgi:hypothetical protein
VSVAGARRRPRWGRKAAASDPCGLGRPQRGQQAAGQRGGAGSRHSAPAIMRADMTMPSSTISCPRVHTGRYCRCLAAARSPRQRRPERTDPTGFSSSTRPGAQHGRAAGGGEAGVRGCLAWRHGIACERGPVHSSPRPRLPLLQPPSPHRSSSSSRRAHPAARTASLPRAPRALRRAAPRSARTRAAPQRDPRAPARGNEGTRVHEQEGRVVGRAQQAPPWCTQEGGRRHAGRAGAAGAPREHLHQRSTHAGGGRAGWGRALACAGGQKSSASVQVLPVSRPAATAALGSRQRTPAKTSSSLRRSKVRRVSRGIHCGVELG